MKIGVLSDTHVPIIRDEIPEAVARCFKGTDMILHAGDLVEICVIDALKKITPNVVAVSGNMDSEQLQTLLPRKKTVKAGKYMIGLIHGWGAPQGIEERIAKEFKNVDIIVFGHTHKPLKETKQGILFFNPGSATDKVFAKENTVGILELGNTVKATIIKI
ncbi:MAG: metallophosphatase family protein [Candidatus Omnitrophica bacterium]|nr:metallophosphatase family protein [Candidatus Omnitrophota bacterium]MCG2704365.1 metallophosphatase family protein [Candidatus Omnitrophota bacterium]